ncbi:PucR family transcriptional regulator [Nocardioides caeni]
MMAIDQELKGWIAEFVGAQSEGSAVETWVNHVLGRIVDAVPQVRDDAALQSVVRSACDAHWRSFLANLGQPTQTFHLVQEAREVPMVVAQHGYGLPVIFEIYTAGEQAVWEFITAAVKSRPADNVSEADALVHFWTRSSTWFDHSVEQSVAIYQQELERIRQGDAARRLEVVRAVVGGELVDPREISARLGGHPLSAYQTALLLHTADDARIADLSQAAHELTTALKLRSPLVVHPGGRDLWAWVSSAELPDLTRLHSREDWLKERQIVAAVGSPAPGVDGFCSSHAEALATQRITLVGNRPSPLTFFTEVELMSLVGNTDAMRRFVYRTLGRLAGTDEQTERLRTTVQALLSTGSHDAAAKILVVHKNTVRYRVERAEELMGRRVSESPTEIDMALRCYTTFLGDRLDADPN